MMKFSVFTKKCAVAFMLVNAAMIFNGMGPGVQCANANILDDVTGGLEKVLSNFSSYAKEAQKQVSLQLLPLEKKIWRLLQDYSGEWSVYVKDLDCGASFLLNDIPMYPASTIKAYIMASTFDQMEKGEIEDSDSIRSLLESMITVSSNDAANALIKANGGGDFAKGFETINEYVKENGYSDTECHTTLLPTSYGYLSDGLGRSQSSARDCGRLLERIYRKTCVSASASEDMLELLLGQQVKTKIPAGIPSGIKIANKTGETSEVQHDMAIVYGPDTTYILVVYSTTSEGEGVSGVKEISKTVYDFFNQK